MLHGSDTYNNSTDADVITSDTPTGLFVKVVQGSPEVFEGVQRVLSSVLCYLLDSIMFRECASMIILWPCPSPPVSGSDESPLPSELVSNAYRSWWWASLCCVLVPDISSCCSLTSGVLL